jgi:hypothetical protein
LVLALVGETHPPEVEGWMDGRPDRTGNICRCCRSGFAAQNDCKYTHDENSAGNTSLSGPNGDRTMTRENSNNNNNNNNNNPDRMTSTTNKNEDGE